MIPMIKCPEKANENSCHWTGDNPTIGAVHLWMYRNFGTPFMCDHCGENKKGVRKYDWANISGEYKRDRKDWKRLCRPCHRVFDGHTRKIKQFSLEGEFIKEFPSLMSVKRELGLNPANLHRCCRGDRPTAYGYKWKFVD